MLLRGVAAAPAGWATAPIPGKCGAKEEEERLRRAREAEESAPPVICPIALVAGHPSAGAGFNDGHPTAACEPRRHHCNKNAHPP